MYVLKCIFAPCRASRHVKVGRTFLCAPPVLHLRSHSLLPVIHWFTDRSFLSFRFRIACESLSVLETCWNFVCSRTFVWKVPCFRFKLAVNDAFCGSCLFKPEIGNLTEIIWQVCHLFQCIVNFRCDPEYSASFCRYAAGFCGISFVFDWYTKELCTLRCLWNYLG